MDAVFIDYRPKEGAWVFKVGSGFKIRKKNPGFKITIALFQALKPKASLR